MKRDFIARLISMCYTYEDNFNPRYSEFLSMFADIDRGTNLTRSKIRVQQNKQNKLQSLCTQLACTQLACTQLVL